MHDDTRTTDGGTASGRRAHAVPAHAVHASAPGGPPGALSAKRVLAASFIGTTIEFYDFYIYGTAAALVLGPLFFPQFSPAAATLAAFGTFAVGILSRPLGSLLFGHIGDRLGRRRVLLASALTTGAATVGVGLLPGHDRIGLAAPLLLLLLRFLQGMGLGGEWTGAVLLASEHAPERRRGLWAGVPQTGPALGFLLATGITLALDTALTDEQFDAWGWRVPFWVAGLLTLVGYLLRASLQETPAFRELAERRQLARSPLGEVLRGHRRRMLLIAGAVACGYAVYYIATTWSLAYTTGQRGLERSTMLGCLLVAVAVMGAVTPLAALLGDRYGRRRVSLAGCAAMAVCVFPYLALLRSGEPVAVLLGSTVTLMAVILMIGVQGAYVPELFEPRLRCTGTAVSYSLGAVLGGALTPMIANRLSHLGGEDGAWWVAAYLAALCVLGLLCFALLPATHPVRSASGEEGT